MVFDAVRTPCVCSSVDVRESHTLVTKHTGTAAAYLPSDVRNRENLTILTNTKASRVIMDESSKTVTGVEVVGDGDDKIVLNASKEVVLSGGTWCSSVEFENLSCLSMFSLFFIFIPCTELQDLDCDVNSKHNRCSEFTSTSSSLELVRNMSSKRWYQTRNMIFLVSVKTCKII